ncbi:hypothetical protein GCM10007913_40070 [Devosia yakushimensis]|uniref:Uncharacterized protein n=1 Tax=Devosia yakushimensis TaxID=470028 RepID=A0ABQ5UJ03_9HYPH|nr:hypothetical protein [Devosia yakushimensis]GLQ12075.1 hypothetical protein GCM10007913_40070 [Devosia yakushimensis]
MKNKASKAKIIADVCAEQGIDQSFIEALLDLETDHGDLLAWGARPHLRRDVGGIVEQALAKHRAEGGDEVTAG